MVVNTNVSAQVGARLLAESSTLLSKSLARLSSGSKIVSPEDDAAGLAVSIRFDALISRTSAAVSNLNNAVSYTQTQDGFLKKVAKALDRMGELAILAQDGTKTDSDRALYQREFSALGQYIADIADKDFNGVSLFDGTGRTVTSDGEGASFTIAGIQLGTGTAYATAGSSDISTSPGATAALGHVKTAITQLTTHRATLGATMARLQYTTEQLGVLRENLSASNSRLRDVDVAEETTQFARYNILVQAGTAMLAQANVLPESTLRLLG